MLARSLPRRRRDVARRARRRDARGAYCMACAPLLSLSLTCRSRWLRLFSGSSSPAGSSSRTMWRSLAVQTVRPAPCGAPLLHEPSSIASCSRSPPHQGGRPADTWYACDAPARAFSANSLASRIYRACALLARHLRGAQRRRLHAGQRRCAWRVRCCLRRAT